MLLGEDYTGPGQQGVAAPAALLLGDAPTSTRPARFRAVRLSEAPNPTPPITADGVPCVN